MERIVQTNVQEIANALMLIPERARERLCYMIEGALLTQEPAREDNLPESQPA